MISRADELPNAAGEWKITFPGGAVNVYTIDRHGRMSGTVDGKDVTGRAVRQNDQFTHLTFRGDDRLERLWLNSADDMAVTHFDHASDYPSKEPTRVGTGTRRQPAPAFSQGEPNSGIGDLAGQWSIVYGDDPYGPIHIYSFDKQGKLRGRECGAGDVPLTGQVERRDGVLLLAFNEVDKLERLALRVDGRLAVEHWAPKAGYGARGPDWIGVGTPVTGRDIPGVEAIDQRMLDCLNKIGCSGATFAVGRGGRVYISRGYGWGDFEHNVRIEPDTPMGIASCSKPIAAAMVRQLCREKNLPLSLRVLPFFKVKPAGEVVDRRVWDITVQHLIDHQAGWQVDPVNRAWQAYNGSKGPISVEEMLPYVAVQRLEFAPGTKTVYDNFGYQVLDRMVVHLSGRSWVDYLRNSLCRPYGVRELKWVRGGGAPERGEPPQVWNGLEMNEQKEYRYAVSAPALCTFMGHFWIDGSIRDNGNPLWVKTGSWDNSTSAMVWRPDGVNVAWAFNGRKWTGVGEDNFDPGEKLWKEAIDWLLAEQKIPSQ
jgi:CubicO group peptidase (beta-lactamase class C family)